MNIELQHEWFDMTARDIVKDLPDTTYTIIAIKDRGYRVMIEHGKIKRGFNCPFSTNLKEFTKIFSENIDEIKRIKNRGLYGSDSL